MRRSSPSPLPCLRPCAQLVRAVYPHLAGVQPILQRVRAPEARDDQVIEGVFARQGQQGSAHPHAQQHEEAGEMLDPHLEGLRRR